MVSARSMLRHLLPSILLAAAVTAEAGSPHAHQVPRFAQLDVDASRAFPLRAIIRHAGSLYLAHGGPAASSGDRRSVELPVVALDGDAGGTPRRPRVLCEDSIQRVAVYVDAGDLATVASRAAVLVPADLGTTAIGANTPGVHVAPGTVLAPMPGASTGSAATLAMRYRGLFLDARGLIATDHVDVVFTPDPAGPSAPDADGELTRNVSLSAHPGGPSFAWIAKEPRVDNQLLVRRLGAPVRGSVLVRFDEDGAYAIGWVPVDAVRDVPASAGGWGEGGLIGDEAGPDAPNQVHLTRGTLLADPAGGEIVGVVEVDHDYRCEANCTGPTPLVSVDACTGSLRLRAVRQAPSPARP